MKEAIWKFFEIVGWITIILVVVIAVCVILTIIRAVAAYWFVNQAMELLNGYLIH